MHDAHARRGHASREETGPKDADLDDDVIVEAADVETDLGDASEGASNARAARVRLNKLLADHGIASRRGADELISAGKVSVDGEPATELGLRVDPERQRIEIDGVVLRPRGARRRYYLLNKPSGVVCTNDGRELRPRAVDLVTDPQKGRIYTVGRLDEASLGLILLTNDGEFANRVMHPRYGVQKTYLVKVRGEIDDGALQQVREGVHLSEGRTAGARILVERRGRDHSLLTVMIREGMNREIRRTFAKVGYKVLELRRTRIGPLGDRGLKTGRWRELGNWEVDALLSGKDADEEPRRGLGRKGRGTSRRGPGATRHGPGARRRDDGGQHDDARAGLHDPDAKRHDPSAKRYDPSAKRHEVGAKRPHSGPKRGDRGARRHDSAAGQGEFGSKRYDSKRPSSGARRPDSGAQRHGSDSRRQSAGAKGRGPGATRHGPGATRDGFRATRHGFSARRHESGAKPPDAGGRRFGSTSDRHESGPERRGWGAERRGAGAGRPKLGPPKRGGRPGPARGSRRP